MKFRETILLYHIDYKLDTTNSIRNKNNQYRSHSHKNDKKEIFKPAQNYKNMLNELVNFF
jgi:hypothetical protein